MNNGPGRHVDLASEDDTLLTLVMTNINDIIFILGPDEYCRYVSPSVKRILGYSTEELVDRSVYDYYHADDLALFRALFARAKAGLPAISTRCEYRFRRKDGSYCWLESDGNRILDAAGKLTKLLVICRDITARKQAERELRSSHDQLALAIDAARAGVWGFANSNARPAAYPQWGAILGYAKDEVAVTREAWLSLCHPEDRGLIEKAIDDHEAGERTKFEIEYRIRHKNGAYRWVLANGKKVSDSREGEARHWAGLLVDITDIKCLEEARRESERRLRDFAQAIPDVSMIVDEHGRYVEVFGQNEKLLPRPHEELRGRTMHQVLAVRDADFLVNTTRRIIRAGQPQQFGLELTVRGHRRFAEVRAAPMNYLAAGKKTVAMVFTDVTEKRQAEKMVEHILALRRRSDFIEDIIRGQEPAIRDVAIAKAFGIDLSIPLFCCQVRIESADSGDYAGETGTLHQSKIIELLCNERQMFVWDCRGDIGVIVGKKGDGNGRTEGIRAAERVLEIIAGYDPELRAVVGVGCPQSGLEGIRQSYRQALSAARVARSQGYLHKACHFYDIGIYKLLVNLGNEDQAGDFVQETLGKLMKYDRQKGTNLLQTLDKILQSPNLKVAAQKLFLHYNTAVKHKHRIEAILGVSIEDVETKLMLTTAIKLLNLGEEKLAICKNMTTKHLF
ncbi:MAG: PAS domain S-box protein [Negativicutes bacterium]|nr:PAS domain S-box protein [Negativicutes bacterium]